ncbi:AraC family transcriptional regulator [Gemmobacter lanyuensis]
MTDSSESRRYVSRGIAHVPMQAMPEVNVSFVLMRQFTMLAFTSAIEPLRVANQLAGRVLFRWHVYTQDGAPITCSNGIPLTPEGPLPAMAPPGYVMICGGVEPEAACTPALTDWARAQWRHGRTVGASAPAPMPWRAPAFWMVAALPCTGKTSAALPNFSRR